MSNTAPATTLDLGNGESLSRGVFPQADGTFLAMTFTRSRAFKTERGARRWLGGAVATAPKRHRHDFRDGDVCSTCDEVRS